MRTNATTLPSIRQKLLAARQFEISERYRGADANIPSPAKIDKSDAAIVQFGKAQRTEPSLEKYKPSDLRATSAAQAEIVSSTTSPIFEPGKEFSGSYFSDGSFKTEDGKEGRYFAMTGGHIGFEIDGYRGILTGNQAVAFHEESGKSLTMNIHYRNGQFKVSNVQEFKPEPFNPTGQQPLIVEGQNENISIAHNENGELKVTVKNPETGETTIGEGYLNPDGTFVLGWGKGVALTGHYAFNEDGKLTFYSSSQKKLPRSGGFF